MPTIGLCMIVKDEAEIIRRCLDSARPLIDYVLVEDTGSTDGTPQVVLDWLAETGVPGQVIHEPWRDFAQNRTHVLGKMREVEAVDYVLMIDADDMVVMDAGFDPQAFKAGLKDDALQVLVRHGPLTWLRPQIGSNRIKFTMKGVVHEWMTADKSPLSFGVAEGLFLQSGKESARGKNPRKYLDDVAVLQKALAEETDPEVLLRYEFYLAQSYRDAGEKDEARRQYRRRASLGGWPEEVYCALFEAAKLDEALGDPPETVIAAFQAAAAAGTARAEPRFELARYCFQQGRFEEAYQHARGALALTAPANALFLLMDVYNFRLLDAFAVAAFQTGRWAQCLAACERLIAERRIPPNEEARVRENAVLAAQKLDEAWAARGEAANAYARWLELGQGREEALASASEVATAYEAASAAAPQRAEPFYALARFCRSRGLFAEGLVYAYRGLGVPRPAAAPGVEAWIYDWGLLDEVMANAFWAGRYAESLQACDRLLREKLAPPEVGERVARNRQVLAEKLEASASAA